MSDFDDLIAFENEHTYLDFKAIQYTGNKHEDLLKDLIAIANAAGNQDRHIILGVNYKNNGERDIVPIEDEDFIDSAQYQQLAYENIEPKINFDYFAYNFKGDTVGILKISDCNDKPYMMKKEYGGLNKGDSFIRRGDSQDRLHRHDIDKIIKNKSKTPDFSKKIVLGFADKEFSQKIELPFVKNFIFPSQKAKNEIETLLKKKRKENNQSRSSRIKISSRSGISEIQNFKFHYPFGRKPLKDYTIKELEEELKKVEDKYRVKDNYELYEVNSQRLNLKILNKASAYIEDASVEVKFCNSKDLVIPEKIFRDTSESRFAVQEQLSNLSYPNVKISNQEIKIFSTLGNIKHHIPQNVFERPLRILFTKNLNGKNIKLTVKLFAKNLKKPLKKRLQIEVIEP